MTKTQMPEPFAYAHPHAEKGPLFTTAHMESYAEARVREALEEAAQACEARIGQHAPNITPKNIKDCDEEARLCAAAIRALTTPQQ